MVYQIKTPRPEPGYFLFFYRTRAQIFFSPGRNLFLALGTNFFQRAPALSPRAYLPFFKCLPFIKRRIKAVGGPPKARPKSVQTPIYFLRYKYG